MKEQKKAPKIPMSFRVSNELKETISKEAASEGMKTSDYLSQFLNGKFLNQKTSDSKDMKNFFHKKEKDKNHLLGFSKKFEFQLPQELRSSIPISKLEYTKDNQLIVHINPHSKNEFLRYLAYFRKKYGGSDSEIILAAVIAAAENRRSIQPKPFKYYLKGKTTKRGYIKNRGEQSKEELDYPKIIKHTFGLLILLFVVKRLWKWSGS